LGVCMDATSSIAFCEGGHEEGCALRGFEKGWRTQVYPLLWIFLLGD
jgi:hypothetical protein